MRIRARKALIWTFILIAPALLLAGFYLPARAATARRVGGPLWLTESGSGSLDPSHPNLWIGFGLKNSARSGLRLASVEVIPVRVLCPKVAVIEVFFTDLPVGCPPVNDDPRAGRLASYEVKDFLIPARQTRGAFVHFHLNIAGEGGGLNVYRLRVTYRSAGIRRVFEPPLFVSVYSSSG